MFQLMFAIAGGIVLAVLILNYWRLMVRIGLAATTAVLLLSIYGYATWYTVIVDPNGFVFLFALLICAGWLGSKCSDYIDDIMDPAFPGWIKYLCFAFYLVSAPFALAVFGIGFWIAVAYFPAGVTAPVALAAAIAYSYATRKDRHFAAAR